MTAKPCGGAPGLCPHGRVATFRGAMWPTSIAKRNGQPWRCPACSSRRTGALLSKLPVGAARRTLLRLLRAGTPVLMAAAAVGLAQTTVLGWIERGTTEPPFGTIAKAYAKGRERIVRQERTFAKRAARLLRDGSTIAEAAHALGCSRSYVKGMLTRARGSDGRAPDKSLRELARATSRWRPKARRAAA
jgi:hypothetical protein